MKKWSLCGPFSGLFSSGTRLGHTDCHQIYSDHTLMLQVETIGDKYMAASGLPERCTDHAQVVCSLVLDMADMVKDIRIKRKSISVSYFYN